MLVPLFNSVLMVSIIVSGLAVFAMYFGTGNLIFPIKVGVESQGNLGLAMLGLFVTAIMLPYVAVIAPMVKRDLLKSLGKYTSFFVLLMIILMVGPFGAIPRCITFSFTGLREVLDLYLLDPGIAVFSLLFLLICMLCVFSKSTIIDVIGSLLAPLLLLFLFVMFVFSLIAEPTSAISATDPISSMLAGTLEGYNTMDVLAGTIFYPMILAHIRQKDPEFTEKQVTSKGIKISFIGLGLLSLVYFALAYSGSKFSNSLASVPKGELFVTLGRLTMGPAASIISGIITLLACITTVVALIDLSSRWFMDVTKHLVTISYVQSILTMSIISYLFALIGLDAIIVYIAKAMYIAYPALIALNLGALIEYKLGMKRIAEKLFWGSLIPSCVYYAALSFF